MGLIAWIVRGFGYGVGGAIARDAYDELKEELREPTPQELAQLQRQRKQAEKAAAKAQKREARAVRSAAKKRERQVDRELAALKKKHRQKKH